MLHAGNGTVVITIAGWPGIGACVGVPACCGVGAGGTGVALAATVPGLPAPDWAWAACSGDEDV